MEGPALEVSVCRTSGPSRSGLRGLRLQQLRLVRGTGQGARLDDGGLRADAELLVHVAHIGAQEVAEGVSVCFEGAFLQCAVLLRSEEGQRAGLVLSRTTSSYPAVSRECGAIAPASILRISASTASSAMPRLSGATVVRDGTL